MARCVRRTLTLSSLEWPMSGEVPQDRIALSSDPKGGDHPVGIPTLADATTRIRSNARLNNYSRVKEFQPNYHILAEHGVAREILLIARALHTPQLLQSFGIDVVVDLPGVGFQGQGGLAVPYECKRGPDWAGSREPNISRLGGAGDRQTRHTPQSSALRTAPEGARTIVRSLSINLALPVPKRSSSDWHDILTRIREAKPLAHLAEGHKRQRELIIEQFGGRDVPIGMVHWSTAGPVTLDFLKPLSRGSIMINSTDALMQPVIDFRTTSDPADLDLAAALFDKQAQIISAGAMQALGPWMAAPFEGATRAESKELLRTTWSRPTRNSCYTVAIVPREMGGMVGQTDRGVGVEGLRVVDVSY
ncbi:hypothetical protein MAPG_06148 [Magnaporthiopsis poae ATCC 64411]|uniref:Glucose-methanol-choline oxidoreductase C-terminal domain-containing protein n=1 Tax=Magnaporthiopsis poae (strain ATCC 64411 / 73-15) TaxID=644358 RepID=A0A0C4E194_MAGP6|nr:hypothetical protein MAPG_06148 [Magnaporthiopsis poae ATCC 64411]